MRRDGERVTVAVRDGHVRVDAASPRAPSPPSFLARSDMVVADGASTFVPPASVEKGEKALSWRVGLITFDQTTLADTAAEFNRYNAKPIRVAPDEAWDFDRLLLAFLAPERKA